jgi:tricarballylate dehydrogenase
MSAGGMDAFDIVVVGCGIAGLCAAVSAMEAGARVAVLERAPKEDRGGNTRWTQSLLRMKSETEITDDLEHHLAANGGHYLDPELVNAAAGDFQDWPSIVKTLGFTDPEIVATLAREAAPALQWLKRFGIRFDVPVTYFLTAAQPRMAPVGGGLAMIDALATAAEQGGVRFFYETAARRLIEHRHSDDSDRLGGVLASDPRGRPLPIPARAVILASGGFQGNPEMLTRYLGPRARYLRPVARGGYYNKGEGIRMALDAGAATAGDFGEFHAEPVDPRSGAPEPVVMVFNYGILVNRQGERFADEAPATSDACYEAVARQIYTQPDGIAYAILDAGLDDVPGWRRAVRSDQPPIEAATLDELAGRIGIPAEALLRTAADYNAACAGGPFTPLEADGLATRAGYAPRKSNWARPIATPPFIAFPIICGNCFTFGGVKTSRLAEVLNADGTPIAGLYAAGEMTGLYYKTYTGATSVLRGAVFGRIAGAEAAAWLAAHNP